MPTDDLALAPYVPRPWSAGLRRDLLESEFGCLVPAPPLSWAQYDELDPVTNVEASLEGDAEPATASPLGADRADGVGEADAAAGAAERRMVDPTGDASGLVVVEAAWGVGGLVGDVVDGVEGKVVCGVVLSQTCDIMTAGPGARHPFVQVAPVVKVENLDENRRKEMLVWAVADRALLEPPGWEGTYVADLRLSIPMSKGVLARHLPLKAFPDEKRMLEFAGHVATKVGRPALHDFLSETVANHLNQTIRNSKDDPTWFDPVEEVLVLAEPTRLAPASARLLVVSEEQLDPTAKEKWREVNEQLVKRGRTEGITLRVPQHAVARNLKADVYRSAVRLYVPELRTPPYDA